MIALTTLSLILGLASVGSLFLAISTDYWLYTKEPVDFEQMILEGQAGISEEDFPPDALEGWKYEDNFNETVQIILPTAIQLHSGLWRSCVYYEDLAGSMRKASPIIVFSFLILMIALGCSTLGNSKRDNKTMYGTVQYVVGALILAVGMIIYISAVNDEVARRKKPLPNVSDDFRFHYYYGWDILFAAAGFTCALMASVSNISLYMRRYTHMDEICIIVPGLDLSPYFKSSTPELTSRFRIPGLDKRTGYDPVNLIELDVLNNHRSNVML